MTKFIESCEYKGQFIGRNDIHDRSYILDFIKESYHSNQSKPQKYIQKLLSYEDIRNHKNKIYAVELRLMIPSSLSKNQEHEVTKSFMLGISKNYKVICYLYKFITIGKGRYIHIVAFERKVYFHPEEQDKCYKKDMFINKNTGRTTKQTDSNAIHRCKKGEVMIDKNGKPIKEIIYVSNKKRFFHYDDGKFGNAEARNKNFNSLIERLKGILIQAVSKIISHVQMAFKLKNKSYSKTFSKNKRIKILNYNNRINQINLRLVRLQDTFYRRKVLGANHDQALNEFYTLFYRLVKITENEEFRVTSKKKYKASISLTKHMSFKKLNDNLDLFVIISERKINDWYAKFLPVN